MSGHSKWATIKRKKGKLDAQRGKLFSRLNKEIMIAARDSGGDPEMNPRLRTAIAAARTANMPQDNIKRAIQKGTGELPGTTFEEVSYEGYGPGGVAILIEVVTDNKNRTVAEIRSIFSKNNGNLGETGCVGWMFDKRGVIRIPTDRATEDDLMEVAIEAGAEDMQVMDDFYEVYTPFTEFESVRSAIDEKGFPIEGAEITMIPQNYVKLEDKKAEQMLRLMGHLDDHDDIQNVYANFDIDDEIIEKFSGE
ncbi:MAG: YebC/PmpR family DNA-binding transcriptional regulator [candidate division Zixibacteria bacterium]|nr:YebC/PmpR family DNA-binding transcriptional regulator [candidate division Zixibacteria bacterium]